MLPNAKIEHQGMLISFPPHSSLAERNIKRKNQEILKVVTCKGRMGWKGYEPFFQHLLPLVQSLSPVWVQPHEVQHARLPSPSLSPGVCSNSSLESIMPSNYLILSCFRWPEYWIVIFWLKLHWIPVWSLGREDPLEKEMATRSSISAWVIPQTEEPCRLQSMGS